MKRLLLYALLGIAALAAGFALNLVLIEVDTPHQPERITLEQGVTLSDQAIPVIAFTMTGPDGRPFTQESLRGHWNYLFFGFTHCGYICPTTMKTLVEALHLLAARNEADNVRGVFISTDPDRDTPERLREWLRHFDPALTGATGHPAELARLTHQLGIVYRKIENPDEPGNYQMEHGNQILVIDPQGRYAAVLSPPHTAESLANDMITLKQHAAP